MTETINEKELRDPEYDESGICPKCKAPLEIVEDCSGVQFTSEFNPKTKEWEKTDTNYYGDTTTTYKCTECEWKSDEDFTDGDYHGM